MTETVLVLNSGSSSLKFQLVQPDAGVSLADGIIEIAPVAYMRGRTLSECFVVIDEAQNCTYTQIKMLLTRLGWLKPLVALRIFLCFA